MSITAADHQPLVDRAVRYLMDTYSAGGNRTGWLMLASIFVEAWDLYSISFVLIYIKESFSPSPLMLGLAAAATQGGALIGALIGGWLSDRFGRRAVFLITMIMFIVVAFAQAFSTSMLMLVVLRFILGLPLGSDISNAYTYIMESMPAGQREVMGNRWQFMFAVGEIVSIAVIAGLVGSGIHHDTLWRLALGLGALPALAIFLFRANLPETAVWLVQRGRFREAKAVTMSMYKDPFDILPNEDVVIPRVRLSDFFGHLRADPTRWRATLFGWVASFMQSAEFSTFGFYIPVLLLTLGVSGDFGTSLTLMALYSVAALSGYVGPQIVPRIGQRMLSILGFAIVFVALLVAAWAIYSGNNIVLILAAGAMLWGHYWDAENVMTIPSMVAKPAHRGTASGFAYMFVKFPAFLSIFLFPSLFDAIGKANATLFVAVFPLIGLLAAVFLLPEVFGYKED